MERLEKCVGNIVLGVGLQGADITDSDILNDPNLPTGWYYVFGSASGLTEGWVHNINLEDTLKNGASSGAIGRASQSRIQEYFSYHANSRMYRVRLWNTGTWSEWCNSRVV